MYLLKHLLNIKEKFKNISIFFRIDYKSQYVS